MNRPDTNVINSISAADISAQARAYQCPEQAFANKTLLVTGASDGIGKSVTLALAANGATVILLGRSKKKLSAVYDEIVAAGWPTPAMVPLDIELATEADYDELAGMLEDEFGQLDGLLHSAGVIGSITPLDQYDANTWNKVMQVNVTAGFLLTQAMLPLLRKAPSASLVFTSSGVGRRGRAFWGAYSVSKFATEGLVQVWADELENVCQVRVNAINPGATRTAMRLTAYPAEDRDLLATPDDLLPTYLYLLGDASAGIDKRVNGLSLDAQAPKV